MAGSSGRTTAGSWERTPGSSGTMAEGTPVAGSSVLGSLECSWACRSTCTLVVGSSLVAGSSELGSSGSGSSGSGRMVDDSLAEDSWSKMGRLGRMAGIVVGDSLVGRVVGGKMVVGSRPWGCSIGADRMGMMVGRLGNRLVGSWVSRSSCRAELGTSHS